MSYTPPAGNAANATWAGAVSYAPPAGDAAHAMWGSAAAPAMPGAMATFGAPWAASKPADLQATAPYVTATRTDTLQRARWAKGRARNAEQRAPWAPPTTRDVQKRTPWGKFARRQQTDTRAPWVRMRTADLAEQLPWRTFAVRLAYAVHPAWPSVVPADLAERMPWVKFAHRPALLLRPAWRTAKPANLEQWLPWTKFSRQLDPGWGVATPGGEPPVDEHGTVLVPIREVYVTINTLTLVTVPGGDVVPAFAFSMSLDVDSWTWQWQATLHADALAFITPSGADPVELQATVNGQPFRLTAESYTRQRQFASTRISVSGRGRAAILDAPYAPVLNHGNAADRTAQQLANEALTINGVGIGWDIAWGLTDWLVPGGAWAYQGTYIAAVLDIANAAGGYVQPHDTDATLRILPRYPAAPWDWASLTPDYELPASVVSVEGTEWLQMPGYNRVHVSGTNVGVLGEVTITGTAGGAVAPMVTHPLITHADAARQRGIAELSNTGRIANLSLRLPVLEETGLIKPGALVRYVDNAVPVIGLVRATQLEWSAPTMRQVLTVETHPA